MKFEKIVDFPLIARAKQKDSPAYAELSAHLLYSHSIVAGGFDVMS